MARIKDRFDGFDGGSRGTGPAGDYTERASAVCRGRGGEGFIIRGLNGPMGEEATGLPATDAQWIAWMIYFEARHIPCKFAKSRGMTTVPTEWPEEFDPTGPASDRTARLIRRERKPTYHAPTYRSAAE